MISDEISIAGSEPSWDGAIDIFSRPVRARYPAGRHQNRPEESAPEIIEERVAAGLASREEGTVREA
jgi:hypothetical protein